MRKLPHEIEALLQSPQLRRWRQDEQWLYSALDLVRLASGHPHSSELWEDMKRWEPQVAGHCTTIAVRADDGTESPVEVVTLEHAFRILQSIDSPLAEKAKQWLAEAGRTQLEEHENPELAILRTRRLYEDRGYDPGWVEKRLRGIGARHELTSQWYRRGVRSSEEFRELTNRIMEGVFGMDVAAYRRYKGLAGENLRDQMSEMELALTVLGETTAAILHKQRNSRGIEQLRHDVSDAGQIAAKARQEIEDRLGRRVPSDANILRPLFRKRTA